MFQKNDDYDESVSVDGHLVCLQGTALLYLMLGRKLSSIATTLPGLFENLAGLARNEHVDEDVE